MHVNKDSVVVVVVVVVVAQTRSLLAVDQPVARSWCW